MNDKIEKLRTKARVALEDHNWELYELCTIEDKSEIYNKLLRRLDDACKKHSEVENTVAIVEGLLGVLGV